MSRIAPSTPHTRSFRCTVGKMYSKQIRGKEYVKVSPRLGILSWLPIALVCAQLVLYLVYRQGYLWSTAEDSAYEWATFVAYACAAPVAGILAGRWLRQGLRLRGIAYVALTLGFVFIAGEEISWGQRIFGFAGPEALLENNLQSEANLHNLLGRLALEGAYIAIGLLGIGVGRAVASRVGWLRPVYVYAPGRELFWWFLPVCAYYIYADYIGPLVARAAPGREILATGPANFQEPMEFLLGVGFLLFVLSVWRRSRTSDPVETG